jgi:hypothetical protein
MRKAIAILFLVLMGVGLWGRQASKQATAYWDATTDPTVIAVRLYDIQPVPEVLVGTVLCTGTPVVCPVSITFTIPRAAHRYVVRAVNSEWESGDSNVIVVPGPPSALGNFRK